MKTIRFTEVVGKSGQPEVYLLFTKPGEDAEFQKALKADRIMTVHTGTGAQTDFGAIGYAGDPQAQILIFPRSLKAFGGRKVVGIKYDLLHAEEESHPKQPVQARKASAKKPDKKAEASGKRTARKSKPSAPVEKNVAQGKVLKFPAPEEEGSDEDSELKAAMRRALKALEEGKQVSAFHILQRALKS
jgi:hypothetical protein